MIGKITAAAGAAGVIGYDVNKEKAEILFKNNLFGESVEEMAAEMRAVSDQRNVKMDTWHISLSLDDKEVGTKEQWIAAANAALESLGFDISKTQYLLTLHRDSAHSHTHLALNRIMLDGSIVSDSNIRRRCHEAARAAEKASGLAPFVQTKEMGQHGKMAQLRSTIDAAVKNSKSFDEFKTTLISSGIEIIENSSKTGFVRGMSYKLLESGQVWKGSAVGKAYSYASIKNALGLDQGLEKPITPAIGAQNGVSAAPGGYVGVGGGGGRLARNLTKGREGLGLSQGQKDRIAKESSHEL